MRVCTQQIEKYPQSPFLKPRIRYMLRGFVVYFWVDRLRRKLAIRGESINLAFSIWLVLKFCFAFYILICPYFILQQMKIVV